MKGSLQYRYSEQEITQGIKENNNRILSHLVKKLKPLVFHWILRHGGTEEQAKDNFQDTWVAVLVSIRSGRYQENNFEAYFMKVNQNIWFKYIRHNPNILDPIEYNIEDHSEEELLLALINDKRYEIVCQKLRKLSEECRNILKLRFYEDAALEDIAQKMNISINFVPVRVYRCKKYLLELLIKDPNFTMDLRWKKKIKEIWNYLRK